MIWVQVALSAMKIGLEALKYMYAEDKKKCRKDTKKKHKKLRKELKGGKGVKISNLFNDATK